MLTNLSRSIQFIAVLLLASNKLVAQAPEKSDSTASREQMNTVIYSSSKVEEKVFESPLSSASITAEDIQKAGVTSIPEALRLVPGVIVREATNGIYDVHIRGFETLNQMGTATPSHPSTLIMIDNRPVFSHVIDGAFFESLPIDLNDVERIEVIRGPAGALYGPGAAMGAINIITKKNLENTMVHANVAYGQAATTIANASVGKRISEEFDIIVSANFQERDRFKKVKRGVEENDGHGTFDIASYEDAFPDRWLALKKWGSNLSLHYAPTEKSDFEVAVGMQEAEVQRHSISNIDGTYFTWNTFESYYAAVNTKIDRFSLRGSFQSGKDNLNGHPALPGNYDYTTFEGVAEYDLAFAGGRAHLIPGMSYQSQNISDEDYADTGITLFNGNSYTTTTTSAYLRTDFTPMKKLRIVAGLRGDKISTPDRFTLAYEIAATYKVHEKYLFRAAASASGARSLSLYNHRNWRFNDSGDFLRVFTGNDDLDLFRNNQMEIGFRAKPIPEVGIDVDFFRQVGRDFTVEVTNDYETFEFVNVPTKAIQTGATLSLNLIPDKRVHITAFVTVQETKVTRIPDGNGYRETRNLVTPPKYGGYILDITASKKLSFNIHGYMCAEENKYDKAPFHALNVTTTYSPIPKLSIYVSGRNLLAKRPPQYNEGDYIQRMFLGGVSFNLNK